MVINASAKPSILKLGLDEIQIKEYQERFPEKLNLYIQLLQKHPDKYAGVLMVVPSNTHLGMYVLLDGHHKFCASIMTGRKDAWCVLVKEPEDACL